MRTASQDNGLHQFAAAVRNAGEITDKHVLGLRREVFGDGVVRRAEAELLLQLNDSLPAQCADWTAYLVEAITDHVVTQAEPRGYVSPDSARWLIETLSRNGRACRPNELELVVRILDRASSAPERLASFALSQVVALAIRPEGDAPAAISEAEAELIRRILFAFGGERGASISRAEAEMLFDLNERTDPAANHPAWRELFVKAIANYLMAATTYRAPSRMSALAREEWLEDTDRDIKGLLVGAISGLGELFSGAFLEGFGDAHNQIERAWADRNAKLEAEMAEAEIVSDEEARWLIDRISRDGRVDPAETALLAFLKRESPQIHPDLAPWLAKAS